MRCEEREDRDVAMEMRVRVEVKLEDRMFARAGSMRIWGISSSEISSEVF
jgi:hypothetical protein